MCNTSSPSEQLQLKSFRGCSRRHNLCSDYNLPLPAARSYIISYLAFIIFSMTWQPSPSLSKIYDIWILKNYSSNFEQTPTCSSWFQIWEKIENILHFLLKKKIWDSATICMLHRLIPGKNEKLIFSSNITPRLKKSKEKYGEMNVFE